MTDVITYLAEGGESHSGGALPLEGSISPLLPLPYDMVWSAICFIVIGVLFWKFIVPKFMTVLAEREDSIEGSIARAKEAQTEAEAAKEKYNAQLAEARTEASRIREEARARSKQIVEEAKALATEEHDRIIAVGEKQLQAERERVVAELRKDMGQNSIALAERLLGDQLEDSVKRSDTIDRFLGDLDRVAAAGK